MATHTNDAAFFAFPFGDKLRYLYIRNEQSPFLLSLFGKPFIELSTQHNVGFFIFFHILVTIFNGRHLIASTNGNTFLRHLSFKRRTVPKIRHQFLQRMRINTTAHHILSTRRHPTLNDQYLHTLLRQTQRRCSTRRPCPHDDDVKSLISIYCHILSSFL